MARIITAFKQFFDGEGDPLNAGYLKFLVSGTTSTDKDTYSDAAETVANANPVVLDAEGRCPDVFGSGSYRVTSYDSNDVQIQQLDPVGGTFGASQFDDWNAETIYAIKSIVTGSDTLYYRSLIATNQNKNPTTDAASWELIEFVFPYNATRVYEAYERVRVSTGEEYMSLVGTNAGNTPVSSPTKWKYMGKILWTTVTAAATDDSNTYIATDTTSTAFTRTLPGSPMDQDFVEYKDIGGNNDTNNLTIGRNSNKIMGLSEDMTIETNYVSIRLTYFASTTDWRL